MPHPTRSSWRGALTMDWIVRALCLVLILALPLLALSCDEGTPASAPVKPASEEGYPPPQVATVTPPPPTATIEGYPPPSPPTWTPVPRTPYPTEP